MSEHAIENATAWMTDILRMVKDLKSKNEKRSEIATTEIEESPLSIRVRSGWQNVGDTLQADEYEILLSTGGPALRIVGALENNSPISANLEWQDWGTLWTNHFLSKEEDDALLEFAGQFYFNG